MHPRSRSSWTLLLFTCLTFPGARPAVSEESWLTDSERALFDAFGADAVVDGRSVKKPIDLSRLAKIAREAEPPLDRQIQSIVSALARLKSSPAERARLRSAQERATVEMSAEFGVFLARMFVGQDPWDATIETADDFLKMGGVVNLWKTQAQWLERGLEAQAEADEALSRITEVLEARIGGRSKKSGLSVTIEVDQGRLKVLGKADKQELADPIVQVILHKTQVGGKWVGLNLLSSGLLRLMGVEGMDVGAALQGLRLTAAQERAMGQSLTITQLLPTVAPGKSFAMNLGLVAGAALALDRVEVRVWSGEAWYLLAEVAGLDAVKKKAIAIANEEHDRRVRAYQVWRRKMEIRYQNELARLQIDAYLNRGMIQMHQNAQIEAQRRFERSWSMLNGRRL